MSGEKGVRAPYNFVPFHAKNSNIAGAAKVEKVLVRYRDIEELPRHDVIDPKLKTGEIHVTMRAETPVFVSDGNEHFFRGPNGRFMLPGSTIRGMVRENMQILGFGLVVPEEDLEDYHIFFRDVASAKDSTGGPLKKYYHDIMATETRRDQNQRPYSIPRNVQAGYLRKKGNAYYIQPVKGTYIRVSRKNPALVKANLTDGEAMTVKVAYTAANGQVKSIRRGDRPVPGMEQGVLLYTGKGVGKPEDPRSKNARYLFPAADEEAVPVPIPEEDRISYQEDFETRRNILGKTKCGFWELPKDEGGEGKPVFYLRHNGHTYFGMTLFLRIGYSHKLSDGLPAPDPKTARQEGRVPLDYTHAMLGFAGKEQSYRSRVSFGDFSVEGSPEEGSEIKKVLGQPKPSWYAGYVEEGKHYNESEFYLRGYKFYWLKEAETVSVEGKDSVRSTLRPLRPSTVFRGVVRYKNLHPDELGLLLWALRLNDGCFQSIGMGKPYGFGRMKLTIDRLLEYDVGALYAPDSLCRLPVSEAQDSIEKYIQAYDSYACTALHIKKPSKKEPTIGSEDTIKDFFFMRGTIRGWDETGYMELPEYKKLMDILPAARQIRKAAEAEDQKPIVPQTAMEAAMQEARKRKSDTK